MQFILPAITGRPHAGLPEGDAVLSCPRIHDAQHRRATATKAWAAHGRTKRTRHCYAPYHGVHRVRSVPACAVIDRTAGREHRAYLRGTGAQGVSATVR